MAGEWLKLEKATPEKPEVFAIAASVKIDPDSVVGKLIRVWSWFDTHTIDGNAPGVTLPLLDRIAGVTGFASAMLSVGWIDLNETGISLPHFDRHTGETAKGRALGAKRAAEHRVKSNGKSNGASVTSALPREEKRREEKKLIHQDQKKDQKTTPPAGDLLPEVDPQVIADFLTIRKAKRAPLTETAAKGIRQEAGKAGLTLQAALALCCERGWVGFKAAWVVDTPRAQLGALGPGKTMQGVQILERMKNGLADSRDNDRIPEITLPRIGAPTGSGND